jgi:hypothetical protein
MRTDDAVEVSGVSGVSGVSAVSARSRLARRSGFGRWLRSPDGRAVVALVLLPLLFFVVPAAIGHPAITGDNLIQNFPLRVLTGRQLDEGHLPLWNPYIWSGSPLLGGLNAGSFYPLTFLFAVLAPVAAFVANLLAVYWAGALGMYALCRQYDLRPVASLVGALTYGFAGTMTGQLVHLGVIEGMAWMPLLVLAELRLSWVVLGTGPVRDPAGLERGADGTVDAAPERRGAVPSSSSPSASLSPSASPFPSRRRSPWPWVALLALVVGLEALTGEPRAMAETEVVGAAVAGWLILRPYAGRGGERPRVGPVERLRLFAFVVLAGVWGVALAAAELAPGWTFIKASQRAVETYQFFGTGSLRPSWSLLMLVPDLFGGVGRFGSVRYFNAYNLVEVTGYVGLLPLGAALVLLVRSCGRRRAARSSDWGMWLALALLGLLLTWGSFTPLGHLWAAIPLFGKTRLQSRNLGIVDFALAVLLAFWADRALGATRSRVRLSWLAAVPAAAAVLLCAAVLVAPGPVEQWLLATGHGAGLARRLWPWFLVESLVAAGVIALTVGWRRLGEAARRRALVAVVVADIAFFVFATSTAVAPPPATPEPTQAAAAAVLGTTGRFAIVDTTVTHLDTLTAIGQPDLNAFTRLPSVQGYGSIVADSYGAPTGSHALDTLSPCALETGTFGALRLTTLVASPGDLVGTPGRPPRTIKGISSSCPGAPHPGAAGRRAFYLGWPVALRAATLVSDPTARAPRVGVVTPNGRVRWPRETVRQTSTGWSVAFDKNETAVGIEVEGLSRAVTDSSTLQSAGGERWAMNGPFQDALDLSGWRFVRTFAGTFGVFRRTVPPPPPVWLASGDRGPSSSVRQLSAPDWGGATDSVDATRSVTVIWSESYLPGWHATVTPATHSTGTAGSRELPVHPHGLIQEVHVPAGRWILRFQYRPRYLTLATRRRKRRPSWRRSLPGGAETSR